MSGRPLRYCTMPGCRTLVRAGRCEAHRRAADQARGSAHARGYSTKWAAYSKARLAKHPICVKCGDPATMTNHIISAKQRPDLFWDPKNHESVCGPCNSRQGIAVEGGFGR